MVVIGPDNVAHRRKIEIGRDYGPAVDVVSGVAPGDRLVVNLTTGLSTVDSGKTGGPVRMMIEQQSGGANGSQQPRFGPPRPGSSSSSR